MLNLLAMYILDIKKSHSKVPKQQKTEISPNGLNVINTLFVDWLRKNLDRIKDLHQREVTEIFGTLLFARIKLIINRNRQIKNLNIPMLTGTLMDTNRWSVLDIINNLSNDNVLNQRILEFMSNAQEPMMMQP